MLTDCRATQGAELYIVEGPSAGSAVKTARDAQYQAILPLQGKIPNVAGSRSLEDLLLIPQLAELYTLLSNNRHKDKFSKIVVLCDPDADGIHTRALVIAFIYKHLRSVVSDGRLYGGFAPLYRVTDQSMNRPQFAYTPQHLKRLLSHLNEGGVVDPQTTRYKGLASLNADMLAKLCMHPDSRTIRQLSIVDCAAILESLAK